MSVESVFERLLWSSRLIVLVAVVASIVVSLAMFYVASVDVVDVLRHVSHYHEAAADPETRLAARSTALAHVVEVVDGYLLAAIMLIFGLGLYELFISRIDIAEGSEFAQRLLLIHSLDDLKDRLAKVVLLILVVKVFEYALSLPVKTSLDLLYLSFSVILVSGALWLSHGKGHGSKPPSEDTPKDPGSNAQAG